MAGVPLLEGGCACGEVRYRLTAPPMFVHCCHCTSCQTESGGAFIINALIEADHVETLQGKAEPVMTPSDSDAIRFVRVGTLDTPGALPPDIHIYTRSKLPWVRLPVGVPAAEGYYDVPSMWPAESLARRKAALE